MPKCVKMADFFSNHVINVQHPPVGLIPAKGDNSTDDWAALQKMLEIDLVQLYFPVGTYCISDTLRMKKHYTRMWGYGHSLSQIKPTFDNKSVLEVGSYDDNLYTNWTEIKNMGIIREGTTGVGIHLKKTAVAKLRDISINNCTTGLVMEDANNTLVSNMMILAQRDKLSHGIQMTGSNVSSVFEDIWMEFRKVESNYIEKGSSGFNISGNTVNDIIINRPQFSGVSCPILIDAKETNNPNPEDPKNPTDIMLKDIIIDGCLDYGIVLHNFNAASSLVIDSGWINPLDINEQKNTNNSIFMQNCQGITVKNVQFNQIGQGYKKNIAIEVLNSRYINVEGCIFINTHCGINMCKSSNSNLANNIFCNKNNKPAESAEISLLSSDHINILGNNIGGNIKKDIALNDVEKSIVCNNIVSGTIVNSSGDLGNIVEHNIMG